MIPKERILAAIVRRPVDRIPVDLWYTPEVRNDLLSCFGVSSEIELWRILDLDKIVWVFPEYKPPDILQARQSQVGAATAGDKTMWGVPLRKVSAGDATYHEFGQAPLAGYESPESVADYPDWPDPDCFDYERAVRDAQTVNQEYATLGPWVSFFEIYCQMRGLEQSLMDLLTVPDLADAILDKIEQCQTEMMKRFFDRAAGSMDMVFISDDMGSQSGLLISPDVWDRFFKDRMKRWCDLVHSCGLKVFYHTDGAAEPLMGRLIEAGIDILNPIQHICPGMERTVLKRKYGDKLIFHGGVENQSILPFGTPDQVRRETLDCLRQLGKRGQGYICCSCHNIQPGTPVENIIAMVQTAKEFTF